MQSHPLTQNPWSVDADPEHGLVPLSPLYQIDRARYAIAAMARMVGNSASEPDATGGQPLDAWTVAALMGGWKACAITWGPWRTPCWSRRGLAAWMRTLAACCTTRRRRCSRRRAKTFPSRRTVRVATR